MAGSAHAQEPPSATANEIEVAVRDGLASEEAIVAVQAEEVIFRAGPAAVPTLAAFLSHKNVLRRRRCADLLGRLGEPGAVPHLVIALREARTDEALKLEVARALCRLGSKDGVGPLIDLLESAERRTRLHASIALRRYTHQQFGFEHDGPAAARAASVEQWRIWWRANGARFELVQPSAF